VYIASKADRILCNSLHSKLREFRCDYKDYHRLDTEFLELFN